MPVAYVQSKSWRMKLMEAKDYNEVEKLVGELLDEIVEQSQN